MTGRRKFEAGSTIYMLVDGERHKLTENRGKGVIELQKDMDALIKDLRLTSKFSLHARFRGGRTLDMNGSLAGITGALDMINGQCPNDE